MAYILGCSPECTKKVDRWGILLIFQKLQIAYS